MKVMQIFQEAARNVVYGAGSVGLIGLALGDAQKGVMAGAALGAMYYLNGLSHSLAASQAPVTKTRTHDIA